MRVKKQFIDYFRQAIREMSPRSALYRMLKKELEDLGHWRQRRRGPGDPRRFRGKDTDSPD